MRTNVKAATLAIALAVGCGAAFPPAIGGIGCAGAAVRIGVGFGIGLPAFFMLPW